MKKLLVLAFVFLALKSWGQTEKGTLQAGLGGLPIIYFDNSLPTGYSFRMNIGFFAMDKLSVGLMTFGGNVTDINSVGISIYSRYYFFTDEKISLFLEGSMGLGRLTYQFSRELNGIMSALAIGPGANYRINPLVSIELLTQFARLRNESFPDTSTIGNTFIPTIGVQFTLPD